MLIDSVTCYIFGTTRIVYGKTDSRSTMLFGRRQPNVALGIQANREQSRYP